MLRPTSRRGLTYADAVHLLGAGETPFISFLGRAAGVPAAIAATATLSSVDLLAARNEMVDFGQTVFRSWRERRAGLSRFDRTERLTAAHAVLVVSSFFETLGDVDRDITLAEQVALATHSSSESDRSAIIEILSRSRVPMPSAAVPTEVLRDELETYFAMLAGATSRFLEGLSVVVPGSPSLDEVTAAAIRRYEIAYRSLAAEVPEFAIWAAMTDAAAGRAATRRLGDNLATGLAELRSMLAWLPGAAEVGRADLADQYRRELARPIIDAGDLPDGIRLPATVDLYVNPRAQARRAGQSSPIAAESWWDDAVAVPDIQSFLAGYLTGPDATEAPLVVLGQPGSGKSLLTRVLAATLPPDEFLAVRVELRSVPADAPIQDQIEAAVHDTIGERTQWPHLVRSAGGALPVVLLDGFDELLQASGANRADYLEQVRDFQRRERDRGRPVAVLMTTRIVVADRARVPDDSIVVRLDSFNDEQIGLWLAVWDTTNAAGLAARSLKPLTVEVATRFRELAEQPLLLLMLSLYDAWDNALHVARGLERADLYDRLFTDFARRELAKREPSGPIDGPAIAREIHRLELVAIALFNRGAQMIDERHLDQDLEALLRDDRVGRPEGDRPLSAAQLLAGRFFFIHESRVREGVEQSQRSFEFLHATFSEFLVARLVITTLIDLAQERTHQSRRPYPSPVDSGPLYAWLSFAVLSAREPIIGFCRSMLEGLSPDLRAECDAMLRDLLWTAAFPPSTWSLGDYLPVRRSASEREAAFSANLVTLIVLLAPSGVDAVSLRVDWRAQALLWESRLPLDAWTSLWTAMRVRRRFDSAGPDEETHPYESTSIALEDGSAVTLWESMPWQVLDPSNRRRSRRWSETRLFHDLVIPAADPRSRWLREAAFRLDGGLNTVLTHSVAPFWRLIGVPRGVFRDATSVGSNLEVLLELMFASREAASARHLFEAYRAALHVFARMGSGHAIILRMLEEDAGRVEARLVLNTLLEALRQRNRDTHGYWTEHADGPARILAICYRRNGDRELIRAVYDRIGRDTLVNPGQQRFRELLRQEFEVLDVRFPEDLFA